MHSVILTLHLSGIINTLESVKLTLQRLGENKQYSVKMNLELI